MSNEIVLATHFFPDAIKASDWPCLKAPEAVLLKRDEYKAVWLNASVAKDFTPSVNLIPVFDAEKSGWKISLTVRPKQKPFVENVKFSAS